MTEEQCKKLKEGTKIRFKRNTSCGKSGEIFEVKIKNGIHPLVKLPNGFICDCYNNWELLESRPFKVGDRVRCVNKGNVGKSAGWKDGLEYTITDISFVLDTPCFFGGEGGYGVYQESLELVEPAKEEEKLCGESYNSLIMDETSPFFPWTPKWDKPLGPMKLSPEFPSLTTRTMRKLSELSASVRRAFSPEQRKLYKAGFIDSCGKYTEAAKDEVLNVLCDEHKEKLVEFAKEAIETAKEDKEDDE